MIKKFKEFTEGTYTEKPKKDVNELNKSLVKEIGKNSSAESIKSILHRGANPNFEAGMPLKSAIENKNLNIIKLLVKYGGDLTQRKCTPVKWAISAGDVTIIEYLSKTIKRKLSNKEKESLLREWSKMDKNKEIEIISKILFS